MAIIKSKHANNYTVIPNEIFKMSLSIDAVGLITYLLSMPHDWVIYKTTIHTQFNISRSRMDSAFKELQNAGYILSVKKHTEGRLEWEHIVYDKPFNGEKEHKIQHTNFNGVEINSIEINDIEFNDIENVQLISNNIQSKHTQSKKKQSKDKQIPTFNEFKLFALEHKNVSLHELELKYKSWVAGNWHDGNGNPIKNWKTKLLNTLPFLPESKEIKNTKGSINDNNF